MKLKVLFLVTGTPEAGKEKSSDRLTPSAIAIFLILPILNVNSATLPPEFDVTIPLLPAGYTFTGDEPEEEYEAAGRLTCPITLGYYSTDIETFTFT